MSGQTLGGHGTARMPAGLPDNSARDRTAGVKLAQHAIDVGTVDDLAEVLGAMGLLGLDPKPTHSQRIPHTQGPRVDRHPEPGVWNPSIAHGTMSGYQQHVRLKTATCDDCKAAAARRSKERRNRLRAEL